MNNTTLRLHTPNSFLQAFCRVFVAVWILVLAACGSTPEKEIAPTAPEKAAWSVTKVVKTNNSMITLFDPSDLAHHQSEPANWFMYDFAINDDLQTGRIAAVMTERAGSYKVKLTTGELSAAEQSAAGPKAILRLRVINRRLLLSGGDTWPSTEIDHRMFAYDQRWIDMPNGDYGVIITALDPFASLSDYVFQLFKVDNITEVTHAPALPQLLYGQPAGVVGVNAIGFEYGERCYDVPRTALWAPLSSRTMPMPGAVQTVEMSQSVFNSAMPVVLARAPEVGSYGFYIKPGSGSLANGGGGGQQATLIRCAVRITDLVINQDSFNVAVKAIPTAVDRLSQQTRLELIRSFENWLTYSKDPAWHFKSQMVRRSENDGAMVLGILDYLNLSSKESETLLPMSNALRVDFLVDRLQGITQAGGFER